MFQRIIVGCDHGPGALDAVRLGGELAGLSHGTELVLAHVHGPRAARLGRHRTVVAIDDPPPEASRRLLEGLRDHLPAGEAAAATLTSVHAASPAAGLHRLAADTDADLLVLGPARHGAAGRLLLGSDSTGIVHGAPCPVAIPPRGHGHVRADDADAAGPIGVAYDGTAVADGAARLAGLLAARLGRPLEVVTVSRPATHEAPPTTEQRALVSALLPPYDPQDPDDDVLEALEARIASLPGGAAARPVVLHGDPAHALAAHSTRLGLLVVGSRDHGPLRHVLLGGVSRPVLDRAHCPVIVVPRSARTCATA